MSGSVPQSAASMAEAYRREVERQPSHPESWFNLGYHSRRAGAYQAALDAYAKALSLGISDPWEVHLNRAVIYSDDLRRDVAAREELERALALKPDYSAAQLNLGNLLEETGERDEAAAIYREMTAGLDPAAEAGAAHDHRLEALARLVALSPPAGLDDPLLVQLAEAAKHARSDDPHTRANLGFALGRAYDHLGEYERAFAAFSDANTHAKRAAPPYQPARMQAWFEALMRALPPALGAGPAQARTPHPLFICGMFRSGSTLAERVLDSHSAVVGGGEMNILQHLIASRLSPFPQALRSASAEQLAALARDYRAHALTLFPEAGEAAYIVDKRPDNFPLLGVALSILPDAKVINTVRNPLDIGVSVYSHNLDPQAVPYSTDLAAIGHYIGLYRRMMAHWKSRFPGRIHDFDYDAFVRDPEPELRALLDFLDLEWEEACLQFHRRKTTVKTASYWQVREPLHARASGRWQNYEAQLAPLRRALGETD